jgi:hypothetical protein
LSLVLRIVIYVVAAAAVLLVFLGPRRRGAFYGSWLRPRLVAFGILVAGLGLGIYAYRVLQAVLHR